MPLCQRPPGTPAIKLSVFLICCREHILKELGDMAVGRCYIEPIIEFGLWVIWRGGRSKEADLMLSESRGKSVIGYFVSGTVSFVCA